MLSLYDGIGCLAHVIKDKFIPLGHAKYIALEANSDLRRIAAEANPTIPQNEDTATFPGIQHNLLGAYSPAELTEWHTRRTPSNSIKLFTSNTVGRMRLDNTTKVWGWIKRYHKDCKSLIQGGPWESEHALLKMNAVKE